MELLSCLSHSFQVVYCKCCTPSFFISLSGTRGYRCDCKSNHVTYQTSRRNLDSHFIRMKCIHLRGEKVIRTTYACLEGNRCILEGNIYIRVYELLGIKYMLRIKCTSFLIYTFHSKYVYFILKNIYFFHSKKKCFLGQTCCTALEATLAPTSRY